MIQGAAKMSPGLLLSTGFLILLAGLSLAQDDGVLHLTKSPNTKKVKIIDLDGTAVVAFDFSTLPSDMHLAARDGYLTIRFATYQPDGLMLFQQEKNRDVYLALKNGYVIMVWNYKDLRREEVIEVGKDEGLRFDDGQWHDIEVRRQGQTVSITVDRTYAKQVDLPGPAQLLTKAKITVGGSRDANRDTKGRIQQNFIGYLGRMEYRTVVYGTKTIQNEVRLIAEIKEEQPGVIIKEIDLASSGIISLPTTTKAPLPAINDVTIKQDGVHFTSPKIFKPEPGTPMSFGFLTVKPQAMMMMSTNPKTKNFMAFEMMDGNLYLVNKFGNDATRTKLLDKAADGEPHDVSLRFSPKRITAKVDNNNEQKIKLSSREVFPQALGPLYVGASPDMDSLPWQTWARQGYQGCIKDLKVNDTVTDFRPLIQKQQLSAYTDATCTAMPKKCSKQEKTCTNGKCVTLWGKFLCDCKYTDFTGRFCETPAWTGVYDGKATSNNKLTFRPQQKFHHDDIHFRFKSPETDGLIFQTHAHQTGGYMKGELEDGHMKISTNIGGDNKDLFIGDNLNDYNWHTVYIQRRGEQMKVFLDDKMEEGLELPGQDFYHLVDKLYVGGYTDGNVVNLHGEAVPYTGYLRNFWIGGFDILNEVRNSGEGKMYLEPYVPPLIFGDATFPTYDGYLSLPSPGYVSTMNITTMFRATENGIILLSVSPSGTMFVVELFLGKVIFKLRNPGKDDFYITTPEGSFFNDGNWHFLSIERKYVSGKEQLVFTVDNLSSSHAYVGLEGMELDGPLYVAGAPRDVLEDPRLQDFISSRNGFRGCLASFLVASRIYYLYDVALKQNVNVLNTCQEIKSKCTRDSCMNGGICMDNPSDGTSWCDCRKTAWAGPRCQDEPLAYYFRNRGEQNVYGCMLYKYPAGQDINTNRDEVVFGMMTEDKNAILTRLDSNTLNDYIELKLVSGYVVAKYDTNSQGAPTTITNGDVMVADGKYHVVHFLRTPKNASLMVDQITSSIDHVSTHDKFTRLGAISVGGLSEKEECINTTGYRGIIGGLFVNDKMIYPETKNYKVYSDGVVAPHPFKLGQLKATPKPPVWVTKPPFVAPETTPKIPKVIPPVIKGGGSAMLLGAIKPPAVASKARQSLAVVPVLRKHGPRAGAIMGIMLGAMALISSMVWAFYLCKPGYSLCCAGSGSGAPLTITEVMPDDTIPFIEPSSTGAGTFPLVPIQEPEPLVPVDYTQDMLDSGSLKVGSGIGSTGSYGDYIKSTRLNSLPNQNGVMMNGSRSRLASSISGAGYSTIDRSVFSPATHQQFHYTDGSSTTADYDIATGIHDPNYKVGTLKGGRTLSRGHSTSTLGSNYNYTMKNRNMGHVIVTPGPLGEEVRVDCCMMTADGHSVVTGSSLGPPQVWNMEDGSLVRIMGGDILGSTFLHLVNKDSLLVGAINADLEINQYSMLKGVHNYIFQIWDFDSGRTLDMAQIETCSALAVMSDGDKVVFGRTDTFGDGTNIIVWDLLANQAVKEMRYDAPVGNNDYLSFLALSQSDKYVLAGYSNSVNNQAEFVVFDMGLTSYNVSDPLTMNFDAFPEVTTVLPNNEAVTGLRNGDLVIWDLRGVQAPRHLIGYNSSRAHSREVTAVVISSNNHYLVSASADNTLKIWDLRSERLLSTLSGHTDEVWCAAISEDNEVVVSGSRDGSVRLWKLRTAKEICAFNAGVDVFYITMSKDKGTIVGLGDKYGARKLIMLQVVRSKVKRQVLA